MSLFFKDDAGHVFEKKHNRACYLDRITSVPLHCTAADAQEIDDFVIDREDLWECVEKYLPMCYKIAWKLKFYDVDQIVQDVGVPTLIKCHKSFDSELGFKFLTYAYSSVWREFRRRKGLENTCLNAELGNIIYSPICDINVSPDDLRTLQYIVDGLDHYHRHLVELYFYEGLNYPEIGDQLGVSKSTARKHMLMALEQCKQLAAQHEHGTHTS
jgi:RNA polymerase sigma factor (sigma-70 family)